MSGSEKGKLLQFHLNTKGREKRANQADALTQAQITASRRRPSPQDLSEQLGNSSKRALEDAKYNWGNKDSK